MPLGKRQTHNVHGNGTMQPIPKLRISPTATIPAWVTQCSQLAPKWKQALSHHAATHLIGYGDVIQLGSGTTFNSLMDKIIELQSKNKKAMDLIILTSNLQILAKGRDAQVSDPSIFGTMQIVLTGGALQVSLDSLTGEYAAKGVRYDFINPRTVFLGAAGLSFKDGLTITYQFQDEISIQVAYATRPTAHRVILCDHTKLGKKAAWNAELTAEILPRRLRSPDAHYTKSLLTHTDSCTIISTLPDDNDPEGALYIKTIKEEENAFLALIEPLAFNKDYAEKDFAFRLIGSTGEVKREHSLSGLREQRRKSTKARQIKN
jgi:DeoR/GlpR family transcriptional regulator of sugar metabolism